MADKGFFNLHDMSQGIARELAAGITTRIFPGDQAMERFQEAVRLYPDFLEARMALGLAQAAGERRGAPTENRDDE